MKSSQLDKNKFKIPLLLMTHIKPSLKTKKDSYKLIWELRIN